MLRAIVIAAGILLLVAGLLTARVHGVYGAYAAAQLLIGGAVLLFAMLIEARRYRSNRKASPGAWEPTGERFFDPSTGKLTETYYNPKTGERDYREVQ